MSVTTTGPVNLGQLQHQLGGAGTLRCEGHPAASTGGAVLSSQQFTDAEITTALSSITYDPTFGEPTWKATLTSLSSSAASGSLTAAEVQEAIAALIDAVTR